jgi:gas vesicle protein
MLFKEDNMSAKDTAEGLGIGFLLGTAVGLILGILYAPHSGRITRGLVDERLQEVTRRAEKIIEEARDKAEDILKEAHLR